MLFYALQIMVPTNRGAVLFYFSPLLIEQGGFHMAYFTWTADMSVGLVRLDDDHKVLISIINRIADNLENGSDPREMAQAFRALVRYTEIHFGREEAVLSSVNYTELSPHMAEHKHFTQDIVEMQSEFEGASDHAARVKVLEYLKAWLINHIMVEDMAYKPYIADSPKAVKASEVFSSVGLWTQR